MKFSSASDTARCLSYTRGEGPMVVVMVPLQQFSGRRPVNMQRRGLLLRLEGADHVTVRRHPDSIPHRFFIFESSIQISWHWDDLGP